MVKHIMISYSNLRKIKFMLRW